MFGDSEVSAPAAGQFVDRLYSGSTGSLDCKLYVPASKGRRHAGLMVMLHGCGQSAADFAAGTRMNEVAGRHGFLVLYPSQSAAANPFNCWNWFLDQNQFRGQGEPSLIAGVTQEVAMEYGVDARCVFVAGLSAGGAMAVILATTYPEIYAGLGVHSGIPYGAAHDASTALAVMLGIPTSRTEHSPSGAAAAATRTIVFHGDHDRTVVPSNGLAIVDEAVAAAERAFGKLRRTIRKRRSPDDRTYTTTGYRASGRTLVEYWLLHGAGHAWSGGSAQGSYTDENGPDASTQMLRFFL